MNHFLMSQRFIKIDAEDFGLVTTNESGIYLQPEEKSRWIKRDLYDLGWGPEIGFVVCRFRVSLNYSKWSCVKKTLRIALAQQQSFYQNMDKPCWRNVLRWFKHSIWNNIGMCLSS